jgi:energy-coupling factor transporter ATP-binding protein EcfA2
VSDPGLTLDGVTFHYPGTGPAGAALTGVSLSLKPGRVLGVVGANESGKTTLCLVASGMAPAVTGGRLEGSVRVAGTETSALPPHSLAQHCGVLFANPATALSGTTATVFEEVAFGPANLGLQEPEIVERVRWALAATGIEELAARDPARLSGGQTQLVALASVLALRPRYLILDEPTSELDADGTELVTGALSRVAEETGAGILIVEHKVDVLARLADELIALEGGSVALTGEARGLLAGPRLAALGVRTGAGSGTSIPPAAREPSAVPSIELADVTFDYPGGVRALAGVSLRIEPGEAVAIVGPNGSGKSTLIRHLNGLLRPSAGRVLLDGADVRRVHVAQLAGRVGLAFQDPDRQLFAGRVRAEVAFGPRNLGVRGAELEERVAGALDLVGLGSVAEAHPYDLGRSRRKLLSLASVLAMRTPVLALDEPTTGQDARGVDRVRAVVLEAAARGRTVIAVSHDLGFVRECFGRVVVMGEGRIVADGPPGEVPVGRA